MHTLLIRADGNGEIGSGHIMRCSAVAAAAEAEGCEAVFAVSDGASKALVEAQGLRCETIGGSFRSLGSRDAEALADLAGGVDAGAVLVDSYAAGDAFFARLAERGLACTYIDDAYTFANGFDSRPVRRDIAAVVNYSFGFGLADYEEAYCGTSTILRVGPEYAPVRSVFRDAAYRIRSEVGRILVTSGSTNPDGALERMAEGCHMALPGAHIDVVVGRSASFDRPCGGGADIEIHHDVRDMCGLMAAADLAVSAAGTTLYELACVGVPTIAAPIVENQGGNARGMALLGLGRSLTGVGWTASDVCMAVHDLARSGPARLELSTRTRDLVDGRGAQRIFELVKLTCS